jgi:3-methyladenine DNA glycosylase AlkC
MKNESKFTETEIKATHNIIKAIKIGKMKSAIDLMEELKDTIYFSIPQKQRIGRGITWVLNKISSMIIKFNDELDLFKAGTELYENIREDSMLTGIPVFLVSEYGIKKPKETFDFFLKVSDAPGWVLKEFAAIAFRKPIEANRELCYDFLFSNSKNDNPNIRRFVCETLRPVVENKWILTDPDYSLIILKNMFKEENEFPRTSVGNNLSDLSKKHPELIFKIIAELVDYGNKNSYWIAYRACRNLVKKNPHKVMDILKVNEYHYKDRNYHRD